MNKIPDDVIQRIFCFVGDAKDLAAFEAMNETFRRVLDNDSIWGFCEESKEKYLSGEDLEDNVWNVVPYPKPSSKRDTVFVVRALNQCHHWQRSTDSVVLSVITVQQWKTLVKASMNQHFPRDLVHCRHSFPIRGDTAAVLLTLVEECIQLQLVRAKYMSFHAFRANDEDYPSVCADDFKAQSYLQSMDCIGSPLRMEDGTKIDETYDALTEFGVTPAQRDQIVRRFGYRAGITKMDDDLYPEIWAAMIQAIVQMVKPACIMLADRTLPAVPGVRRPLDENETIRDVSPFPEVDPDSLTSCPHCHKHRITHWIVPKQIEDAAQSLRIRYRVAGDEWLVVEGEDVEAEQTVAESKYYIKAATLPTQNNSGPRRKSPCIPGYSRPHFYDSEDWDADDYDFDSDPSFDSDEEMEERYKYSPAGPDEDLAIFVEETENEVSKADVDESMVCSRDYYGDQAFQEPFWNRVAGNPF